MENNYSTGLRVSTKTRDIATSGMLISLVFIATRFLNIRLPISINGGLIHLGNVMLFMSAIVFGARQGATAGSVGMALFDILSGWAPWAPFTFIIRGVMGYIVGTIANSYGRNGSKFLWNLTGIVISGIWMIGGYYITEVILYGNWLSPITSVPGNVIQLVIGAVFGLPISAALKRTKMV